MTPVERSRPSIRFTLGPPQHRTHERGLVAAGRRTYRAGTLTVDRRAVRPHRHGARGIAQLEGRVAAVQHEVGGHACAFDEPPIPLGDHAEGERRTVRMLLVPARTHRMLATTVMRLAAQMPIVESPKEDEVTAALRIVMAA